MNNFKKIDLIEPLQRALAALGYDTPTPIQARALPSLLDGRDLLGCAQTGTGKTAAFALPVLQKLAAGRAQGRRKIRAVVLAPTRELAAQIQQSFEAYGRFLSLQTMTIFGGVSEKPQIQRLKRGVDLVVACPGRFLDLMGRGFVDLSAVECLVLDEVDRMLDMGFIRDIRKIVEQMPRKRQNLLFSATLPPEIRKLSRSMMHKPVRIEVEPEQATADAIQQSVMYVEKQDKKKLIADLLDAPEVERAVVFTRTKHGAKRLSKRLSKAGFASIDIHGNKSQSQRRRALEGFREGSYDVLVATDVASRGIDVDDITHVFQFDLPDDPESYVHRIGRTGRAGREGVAVSFCDASEGKKLRQVEAVIGQALPADEDHAYHYPAAIPSRARQGKRGGNRRRRRRR